MQDSANQSGGPVAELDSEDRDKNKDRRQHTQQEIAAAWIDVGHSVGSSITHPTYRSVTRGGI